MSESSPDASPNIDQHEAIRLATQCAADCGVPIGPFLESRHHSARRLPDALGIETGQGEWQIYFSNRRYEQEVEASAKSNVVDTPGPARFYIFSVNDRTGEAEPFLRL